MLSATRFHGSSRCSWKTTAVVPATAMLAAGLGVEPGEDAQQGALAGATAAEQRHDLTRRDGQIHLGEHHGGTEAAAYAPGRQHGAGQVARSPRRHVSSSPLHDPQAQVGGEAEQRVDQQAEEHDVGLAEVAGLHHQEPDAGLGVDLLADDEAQPGRADGQAQPEEERGQRAGEDHVPQPGGGAEPAGACRFDQPFVDVADPGVGVEVDREERPERHQGDLEFLADADPDDQ